MPSGETNREGDNRKPRTRLVQVASVKKAIQRRKDKKTPPFLSHSSVHRVPNETVPGLTGVSLRPTAPLFIVPWQEIVYHMQEFYPTAYGPRYPWTLRRIIGLVYTLQQTTWDFECLVVTPIALCLVPGKKKGRGRDPFLSRKSCREVEMRMDHPLEVERELSHKFLAYDREDAYAYGEMAVSTLYCREVAKIISLVPQSGLRLCREASDIAERKLPILNLTMTSVPMSHMTFLSQTPYDYPAVSAALYSFSTTTHAGPNTPTDNPGS